MARGRTIDTPNSSLKNQDFVVRKSGVSSFTVFLLYTAGFASIYASLYKSGLTSEQILPLATSAIVIVILAIFTIIIIQRNRDATLATEFQNALFSSAASLRSRFNLIIKANGAITYYSPGYSTTYGEARRGGMSSIEPLLNSEGVTPEDAQKLRNAILHGQSANIICTVRDPHDKEQRLRLSVSPIPRPSGFFLISASDVERRQRDSDSENAASGSGRIDMFGVINRIFARVFDDTSEGIYMTTPDGTIKYANRTLETALGYGAGEITSQRLKLQRLLASGDHMPKDLVVDDYEGELLLKHKAGGNIATSVKQQLLHDDQGNTVGCRAIVFMEKKNQ